MARQIDGLALGALAAGGLFAYAGLKGYSVPHAIQALIKGQPPSAGGVANPIGGTAASSPAGGGTVVSGGSAQAILHKTAAQFGWGSGAQWQALNNVEMAEAGYNPTAQNPSGAYGLAQSLGHPFPGGPAGNGVNEYGGYGLSAAQSKAASEGQPGPQALWMCNYIKAQYGDPATAWAHEQSAGWY